MKTIRAAVVGVGHLGYHHARLYASMDHVDLVGIVDIDHEQAAKVAEEFETQAFDTVEQLVDAGAEAVTVAVPTVSHHDIVVRLLEAGVDVLVEKPIAATVEEAQSMVEAARRADRLLQVGHVERFNGAVLALTENIKKPMFIECHRLSPFPNRGDDVSVVLDLMIHDLDVVLALTGSEITSLDAVGVSVFSKYEDIANVRLRFDSGCVANITASRISVERMRKIRIFEENGYVSTDYSEKQVLVYRRKPGEIPADASPMEWITIEQLEVSLEEPLGHELAAFVESVRDRTRPVVSGEDGLKALKLAFDILEFIQEHQ